MFDSCRVAIIRSLSVAWLVKGVRPSLHKHLFLKRSSLTSGVTGKRRRMFSRGALLLRGGRKGDPDTESGLGTKIYFALMREARRKFKSKFSISKKFVYLRGVLGKSLKSKNFSTYLRFAFKSKKTTKKNHFFKWYPQGVREDAFSVGEPFCSGVGEKETQTLKVVWELRFILL